MTTPKTLTDRRVCRICLIEKSIDDFGKHKAFRDGKHNLCRECAKKRSRDYYFNNREAVRETHRAYRNSDRGRRVNRIAQENIRIKKGNVWVEVRKAIMSGKLAKADICQSCSIKPHKTSDIHGHHYDYSKPLEVVWLCTDCHMAVHGKSRVTQ